MFSAFGGNSILEEEIKIANHFPIGDAYQPRPPRQRFCPIYILGKK